MSLLRPISILLIFFGLLYYFKEPLKQIAPKFEALHSAYSEPLKEIFKEITSASSTTLFGIGRNYIPSSTVSSASSSQSSSSTTSTLGSTEASTNLPNSLNSDDALLPVVSNQTQVDSLSVHGIIAYTNFERSKQGLPSLKVDPKLTSSAESKLQDMFQNQYFQHVSPTGQSVSDVVTKEGYQYIVVGENLALGVFGGDDKVVAAWMASPGHRRNILDARYQDIGVAVGQGMYQGKNQWLIVQHFGKPLSSCESPDSSVKTNIETEKNNVSSLEQQISDLKSQIDQSTGDQYIAKAQQYNSLVEEYNTKLAQLRKDIDDYNASVKSFNVCAGIIN